MPTRIDLADSEGRPRVSVRGHHLLSRLVRWIGFTWGCLGIGWLTLGRLDSRLGRRAWRRSAMLGGRPGLRRGRNDRVAESWGRAGRLVALARLRHRAISAGLIRAWGVEVCRRHDHRTVDVGTGGRHIHRWQGKGIGDVGAGSRVGVHGLDVGAVHPALHDCTGAHVKLLPLSAHRPSYCNHQQAGEERPCGHRAPPSRIALHPTRLYAGRRRMGSPIPVGIREFQIPKSQAGIDPS